MLTSPDFTRDNIWRMRSLSISFLRSQGGQIITSARLVNKAARHQFHIGGAAGARTEKSIIPVANTGSEASATLLLR